MSKLSQQASTTPAPRMTTSPCPAPSQATEDVPVGTIKSEVLVPTAGPPYESPLDLRCPLHWTPESSMRMDPVDFAKGSPESEAQDAAHEELWTNKIYPKMVRLHIYTARGMNHYKEVSPPFYQVMIDEEVDWTEIHECVQRTILKHFGKLEKCGYGLFPARYIWREKYWDEEVEPWW